jgi:hypothetical protein
VGAKRHSHFRQHRSFYNNHRYYNHRSSFRRKHHIPRKYYHQRQYPKYRYKVYQPFAKRPSQRSFSRSFQKRHTPHRYLFSRRHR